MSTATFGGAGARKVTVRTTGTGDNEKTCTITGTDVFGNAITEVIKALKDAGFGKEADDLYDKYLPEPLKY